MTLVLISKLSPSLTSVTRFKFSANDGSILASVSLAHVSASPTIFFAITLY